MQLPSAGAMVPSGQRTPDPAGPASSEQDERSTIDPARSSTADLLIPGAETRMSEEHSDPEVDPLERLDAEIHREMLARARRILGKRRSPSDPKSLSLVDAVVVAVLRGREAGSPPEFESDEQLLAYLTGCMSNRQFARAWLRDRLASGE